MKSTLNKEHKIWIEACFKFFQWILIFANMPFRFYCNIYWFCARKAKEYSHTFNEEFALLFIHGILHLLGYDHEVDNGEHRKKKKN